MNIGFLFSFTDVVSPCNFVSLGVGLDVTLKVDVVSLLQVSGVDSWTKIEFNMRRNWNDNNEILLLKLSDGGRPGIKMTDYLPTLD